MCEECKMAFFSQTLLSELETQWQMFLLVITIYLLKLLILILLKKLKNY